MLAGSTVGQRAGMGVALAAGAGDVVASPSSSTVAGPEPIVGRTSVPPSSAATGASSPSTTRSRSRRPALAQQVPDGAADQVHAVGVAQASQQRRRRRQPAVARRADSRSGIGTP